MKLTPYLSSAEVKNKWSHTSTPSICLRGMNRDNLKFLYSAKNVGHIHLWWEQNDSYLLDSFYCTMQNFCRMCLVYQWCDTAIENICGPAVFNCPRLFQQCELGLCLPWHHLPLSNVGRAPLIRLSEDADTSYCILETGVFKTWGSYWHPPIQIFIAFLPNIRPMS